MGRLTFNGDRLVYSAKRYNIVNTTQYLFSSMKNIADYVIENEAISGNFDKVIFVLRHSIRPRNNWTNEVKLTPLGVNAARIAGQSLQTLPVHPCRFWRGFGLQRQPGSPRRRFL